MSGVVLIAMKIDVVVMIVGVEMIDDTMIVMIDDTMIEIIENIGIEVKEGIQDPTEDDLRKF